jgi:glycosyltransferase involved in cell wall biosynthesis
MKKENKIDVSVVVPVYNTEKYLAKCIDSLLNQNGVRIEIIMIDDGSTDHSGVIAEQYANQYDYIKVMHRENMGVSSARNTGLAMAEGEFVIFIDSDDRVKENSFCELYHIAKGQNTDILIGDVLYFYQDSICKNPHNPVPEELKHTVLCGRDAYTGLISSGAYHPGIHCYLFKKSYLDRLQLCFDESISYDEDELFTSLALCRAESIFITSIGFYFYQQRKGSVVYSLSSQKRVIYLMHVADCLIEYADQFQFSGNDRELKSWLFVKIFNIYSSAFYFLQQVRNTSFILPEFQMELLWKDWTCLSPAAQKKCGEHYMKALRGINNYRNWRLSEWVKHVSLQYTGNEKLLLIYNIMMDEELSEIKKDIPTNWIITTDRKYFSQADAVVFYLPYLHLETGDDIEKREGQIWVAWYPEPEENYPWLKDDEAKELFDIRMNYKKGAALEEQKTHPFIRLLRKLEEKMALMY